MGCYHYFRIFSSFEDAKYLEKPFNDAYRYVDWLLTVPLLLTELVLVMELGAQETRTTCLKLGGAAALIIIPMITGCAPDDSCRDAFVGVQIGYSIADVIAKPLLGLVVWAIAVRKSASDNEGLLNSAD